MNLKIFYLFSLLFSSYAFKLNPIKKKKLKNFEVIKSKPINDEVINTILFNGWLIHESAMLTTYDISSHNIYYTVFQAMTLTWQYVGLFIISHDLHHNKNPSIYQNYLGRLSIFCYGGFSLEDFSKNHYLHHKYPSQLNLDPDFDNSNPILWYLKFMSRYINSNQILSEVSIFFILYQLDVNPENLLLFWITPCLLASIQLFYYGTYLVHEENGLIFNSKLPNFLKLLTCYNFGNHNKHHLYPQIKWHELTEE